jgi:hypothetical protein
MSKRDVWVALLIYFMSGQIVWTIISIEFPWQVWLLGQPVLVAASMLIVGLTMGGRNK